MSEIKPQEIDAISLDKFEALVDKVVSTLETHLMPKKENEEVLESASTLLETKTVHNHTSDLIIHGSTPGVNYPMMVALYDTVKKEYHALYANATICAKQVALNPTTVRQRASNKKVIDGMEWKYMSNEEYQKLTIK